MARAYWKGYLQLSLVTCPIELFPALTQAEKTHFHQINKKTGHRLRQQMVDEETGKVVDRENKGRGYEVGKGRFVEVDEEELKAVQIESTHTIDIDSFVPSTEIDQRYLDRPYYIAPNGKVGREAYAVIREAMRDKDRVALGRVVMANREHLIALEPCGNGLLGTTLRYNYEVREADKYVGNIPNVRVPKDMLKLAEHILDTKAAHFDPKKFNDRYEVALRKLVLKKAAGKKIEVEPAPEKPSNVINLMDALRQSVKQGNPRKRHRKAGRRLARHRKAA
jgi:DNA end-binding protein Ku